MDRTLTSWGSFTLIHAPAGWLIALVLSIAIGGTLAGWAAAQVDAGRMDRRPGLVLTLGGIATAFGGTVLFAMLAVRML